MEPCSAQMGSPHKESIGHHPSTTHTSIQRDEWPQDEHEMSMRMISSGAMELSHDNAESDVLRGRDIIYIYIYIWLAWVAYFCWTYDSCNLGGDGRGQRPKGSTVKLERKVAWSNCILTLVNTHLGFRPASPCCCCCCFPTSLFSFSR